MEAFSDGVIAILITIMVLELKVPHGEGWGALRPLLPTFLTYVLSFVYLGIYWNNHHHLLQASRHVNGKVLWANLHLLFWLSLVPFVTGWTAEAHFQTQPVVAYGVVLFASGMSYWFLQRALIGADGQRSLLAAAVGANWKGRASPTLYALGVLVAFFRPLIAELLYMAVALMWLIPDRRIERQMQRLGSDSPPAEG